MFLLMILLFILLFMMLFMFLFMLFVMLILNTRSLLLPLRLFTSVECLISYEIKGIIINHKGQESSSGQMQTTHRI